MQDKQIPELDFPVDISSIIDSFTCSRLPDLEYRNYCLLASSVAEATLKRLRQVSPKATLSDVYKQTQFNNTLKYLYWRLQKDGVLKLNIIEPKHPQTFVRSKQYTHYELIELMMQEIEALERNDKIKLRKLEGKLGRDYDDNDTHFVTDCALNYKKYISQYGLQYKQWMNINDYVISKPIEDNAVIAIVGDWGTGLQDATSLMEEIVLKRGATVIIHLGDVYYSGLDSQYDNNIIKCLNNLRAKANREFRYYTVPGNHDYYSAGVCLLNNLPKFNSYKDEQQQASYFCLRTKSGKWQFLGMDTGYLDSDPLNQLDHVVNPDLLEKERQWHADKIKNFAGSTLLFSHHQLFSIKSRLNTITQTIGGWAGTNPSLSNSLFEFLPYVSAWFWGHEHAIMFYQSKFAGVPKCRLLGNAAFQEFKSENPYSRASGYQKFPMILPDNEYFSKYTPSSVYDASKKDDYFDHSYAIIDLKKSQDRLYVDYYNVKATYTQVSPQGTLFFSEVIEPKDTSQAGISANTANMFLKGQFGHYMAKNPKYDWPAYAIVPSPHSIERVSGSKGAFIEHNDEIKIKLINPDSGNKVYLNAYFDGINYQTDSGDSTIWIIEKMDVSKSTVINTKDTFYLKNKQYKLYLSDWGSTTYAERDFGKSSKPYKWMFLTQSDTQPSPAETLRFRKEAMEIRKKDTQKEYDALKKQIEQCLQKKDSMLTLQILSKLEEYLAKDPMNYKCVVSISQLYETLKEDKLALQYYTMALGLLNASNELESTKEKEHEIVDLGLKKRKLLMKLKQEESIKEGPNYEAILQSIRLYEEGELTQEELMQDSDFRAYMKQYFS